MSFNMYHIFHIRWFFVVAICSLKMHCAISFGFSEKKKYTDGVKVSKTHKDPCINYNTSGFKRLNDQHRKYSRKRKQHLPHPASLSAT